MTEPMSRFSAVPYTAVHLETTGADPRKDGVVNIAVVRFVDGEPAERFASIVNPRCYVPRSVLRRCDLTASRVANAPAVEDLAPSLRRVIGSGMIAADDRDVLSYLPALSGQRWISVRSFIADAWPLLRDLCIEDLWEFLSLRHSAIDEVPIARGEIEALKLGLVLREALTGLQAIRTYVRSLGSGASSSARWN
jgi:hypothetical protein